MQEKPINIIPEWGSYFCVTETKDLGDSEIKDVTESGIIIPKSFDLYAENKQQGIPIKIVGVPDEESRPEHDKRRLLNIGDYVYVNARYVEKIMVQDWELIITPFASVVGKVRDIEEYTSYIDKVINTKKEFIQTLAKAKERMESSGKAEKGLPRREETPFSLTKNSPIAQA